MKSLIYTMAHAIFFAFGLLLYLLTGRNTSRAHSAMVYFFCKSGGRFNEWISAMISRRSAPMALTSTCGVLGDMSSVAAQKALGQLRTHGYFVLDRALSAEACNQLMKFALTTEARVRPMDGEQYPQVPKMAIYDEKRPLAVRYDYPVDSLLANTEVQELMADPSLISLAGMYLEARPRLDVMSMWWHTNFHGKPDSEAAQYYHFDLDRPKWLKVFIYLTDVGPQDGPHSFIQGSHVSGGIPEHFLKKGYVRLSDEEVLAYYGKASEVTFAAPRGTIIVEDTRGLHKGSPVTGESRLILQLQFSNSLFGTTYPKARLPVKCTASLEARMREVPDVYQAYL